MSSKCENFLCYSRDPNNGECRRKILAQDTSALCHLKKEFEKDQSGITGLKKQIKELLNINDTMREKANLSQIFQREWTIKQLKLVHEKEDLAECNRSLEKEIDELKSRLTSYRNEYDKIIDLEKENTELKSQISLYGKEYDQLIALKKTVDDYRRRNEAIVLENRNLTLKYGELTECNRDLEKEIKFLKEKNKEFLDEINVRRVCSNRLNEYNKKLTLENEELKNNPFNTTVEKVEYIQFKTVQEQFDLFRKNPDFDPKLVKELRNLLLKGINLD